MVLKVVVPFALSPTMFESSSFSVFLPTFTIVSNFVVVVVVVLDTLVGVRDISLWF